MRLLPRFLTLIGALALCGATHSTLRAQAPQVGLADHQYSSADIEVGLRLYTSQCITCHGPNGDQVTGVDLRRGIFKRVASDEDLMALVTNGVAAAGMPSFNLRPDELTGIVAFIRAGFDRTGTAVKLGTPATGQALFSGKGGCATCHRVNGVGPRSAPDLSDVGSVRTPAVLQRTLLDPTAGLLPINRPVRIVTRDGVTIRGRRLNEDTFTVQIIDEMARLRSFTKADVRTYVVDTTAVMPSATRSLTPDEIADVLAYLVSLKGLQ